MLLLGDMVLNEAAYLGIAEVDGAKGRGRRLRRALPIF
jgi:hypothetical protein